MKTLFVNKRPMIYNCCVMFLQTFFLTEGGLLLEGQPYVSKSVTGSCIAFDQTSNSVV